jgi:hypothetical protein
VAGTETQHPAYLSMHAKTTHALGGGLFADEHIVPKTDGSSHPVSMHKRLIPKQRLAIESREHSELMESRLLNK